MNREDYWNDFARSGRVEDYLRYAGYDVQAAAKNAADDQGKKHAGVYHDNGNGIESGADGRI